MKHDIISATKGGGLLEYLCVHEDWRNRLRCDLPVSDVLLYLFDVLAVVLQSFPESYTEPLWEELEDQLWDVIESTCLPLLGVIDINDIVHQVSQDDR